MIARREHVTLSAAIYLFVSSNVPNHYPATIKLERNGNIIFIVSTILRQIALNGYESKYPMRNVIQLYTSYYRELYMKSSWEKSSIE